MNKKSLTIGLCAAAVAATLSAQEAAVYPGSSSYYVGSNEPGMELSIGFGLMDLDKDRTGIDEDGFALLMDFRFNIPSSIVDFELRTYGGAFSFDDGYGPFVTDLNGKNDGKFYLENQDYSIFGLSFAMLANMNRAGAVNPYVGVGLLVEGWDYTTDVFVSDGRHYSWPYTVSEDDSGVTFVARAGIDFRLDACYLRLDASYLGEIYDADDGGQFDLYADIGFYVTQNVRIDAFCDYFTEYKSFIGTLGITLAF